MKYMKSEAETHSENLESKKVDWNDFNYPCCIHLFHYNPEETPEVLRRRAALLRLNHILIIFTTLWNFISNIVATAQGIENGGLRIAISIFSFLLWFPVSLYVFIIPYRIYMKEEDKTCLFYLLSGMVIIFFFIWSIGDFADANGWVRMSKDVSSGMGASAFFSFFTALFSLIISILGVVNVYFFCKRDKVDSEE